LLDAKTDAILAILEGLRDRTAQRIVDTATGNESIRNKEIEQRRRAEPRVDRAAQVAPCLLASLSRD
jgi:hypothetical protein